MREGLWVLLGLLATILSVCPVLRTEAQACVSMQSVLLVNKATYPVGCQPYISKFCSFVGYNYSGFTSAWLNEYTAQMCPYLIGGREHDFGSVCQYYFGCGSNLECQAPLGVPKLPVLSSKLCKASCDRCTGSSSTCAVRSDVIYAVPPSCVEFDMVPTAAIPIPALAGGVAAGIALILIIAIIICVKMRHRRAAPVQTGVARLNSPGTVQMEPQAQPQQRIMFAGGRQSQLQPQQAYLATQPQPQMEMQMQPQQQQYNYPQQQQQQQPYNPNQPYLQSQTPQQMPYAPTQPQLQPQPATNPAGPAPPGSDLVSILISKIRASPALATHYIDYKDLELESQLGKGAYGVVYKGTWGGHTVAIKKSSLVVVSESDIDDIVREAELMLSLPPHPNVMQIVGISINGPDFLIVSEYCAGGSLDKHFGKGDMTMETKMRLIYEIARGVSHIHKYNVIHRDLAARNVLLDENMHGKICDFGMSRQLTAQDDANMTKAAVGPLKYMAPESLAQRVYSTASDVWTFGVVCSEILNEQTPHSDLPLGEAAVQIRDEFITPKLPPDTPDYVLELCGHCWDPEPSRRPPMVEVCDVFGREIGIVE